MLTEAARGEDQLRGSSLVRVPQNADSSRFVWNSGGCSCHTPST